MIDFTWVVIVGILSATGLTGFHIHTKTTQNSSKNLRNRLKESQDELDNMTANRNKWKSAFWKLEKKYNDGVELPDVDPNSEYGVADLLKSLLPAIADKIPQARGILDNMDLVNAFIGVVGKNPELIAKLAPAFLKSMTKGKSKTEKTNDNVEKGTDQVPDEFNIVS